MRDETRLEQIRSTLAVDGYKLTVEEAGPGFDVRITAGAGSCPDCLVPKNMMVSMLAPILGVGPDGIRLSYPSDVAPANHA
ncbi:hypothetical protein FE391_21120 [Nonomuraea sp. KC401]|uniref:hypothetical protein n=1 Tax=unclassified Nonomuraea TaxID=2593643 RepID=UPI0010FEC7F6|nr:MULTISPECIES: hypothetical protein [unclassified Nonomuraea]NBE95561.1 hypothetical protein [Nonomuraea sp. K271]TLF70832.1 hypothetical protein FE391_21120 [Nonomuraea sp. KC401]